jgi:hypothetical protein
MECTVESNKTKCPCSYPSCSRKGRCCECLRHHLKTKELPACCFPPTVERTYDRSFEAFIKCHGG